MQSRLTVLMNKKIFVSRSLFLIIFLLMNVFAKATNYYVSNGGSDGASGTGTSTAWATIARVNTAFTAGTIVAGDKILFQRGGVFYGSLIIGASGTSTSPIVISDYGTGNKPVISGFIKPAAWVQTGTTNIWHTGTLAVSSAYVNLVTLNGIPQQIGRHPNADAADGGYLGFESHTGITSITDNNYSVPAGSNWVGGEIIIRKSGHILERCTITSITPIGTTGSIFGYTAPATSINPYNGTPTITEPDNIYGYFIQNALSTLNQSGEWYFDKASKILHVYSTSAPATNSIAIAGTDNLVDIGAHSYITITNLAFEGSNISAIYTANNPDNAAHDLTIQDCDITSSGAKGIFLWNPANTLIERCTINNVACNGIDVTARHAENITVRGCTITNTATRAGMGSFWDQADMKGMYIAVNTVGLIELNKIDNVGYVGIHFMGNNITVQKNFVNNFANVVDDGGGIYTHGEFGTDNYGRLVQDNIVLNGKGSGRVEDVSPPLVNGNPNLSHAEGIYTDNNARGITITGNTCAGNHERGIYLNDPLEINVTNNVCFNNGNGSTGYGGGCIGIQKHCLNDLNGVAIDHNLFVAQYAKQDNYNYFNNGLDNSTMPVTPTHTINEALQLTGVFDYNTYHVAHTSGAWNTAWYQTCDPQTGLIFAPNLKYEFWRANGYQDIHSTKLPTVGSDKMMLIYNATNVAATSTFTGSYYDVADGTVYTGSAPLGPFKSKVLFKKELGAMANATVVKCFGEVSTVTVSAFGGQAPYTGTGSFAATAGTGSLKITWPAGVASGFTSVSGAVTGSITMGKYYTVKFTTLGAGIAGSVKAYLATTATLTPLNIVPQTLPFDATRQDHEFFFSATATSTAASFVIGITQTTGTVYLDNISVFETDAAGKITGPNLYTSGQFETGISGVIVSSANSVPQPAWDQSSKINNTYYYRVTDAAGASSTAAVIIAQLSTAPLQVTVTYITLPPVNPKLPGKKVYTFTPSGGVPPYKFYFMSQNFPDYTVSDASHCCVSNSNGCTLLLSRPMSAPVSSVDSGPSFPADELSAGTPGLMVKSYPNPANNFFNVSVTGSDPGPVNIAVFSADGKKLYQSIGNINSKFMFGNSFTPGIYFLQVSQGKIVKRSKLVKGKL